jgi:hypothetical protein
MSPHSCIFQFTTINNISMAVLRISEAETTLTPINVGFWNLTLENSSKNM